MFEQRAALRKKESFALTHSKKSTMSSEYLTEEEHERLRKVLENKPLPLWRLFREALLNGGACRDIVEKHVKCKLNGTDLCLNTETRKLIKRSSRAEDLEEKFKIEEMSSISTLEFVWENKSLWSGYLEDETDFCEEVARTNKLELLKWAREEKECEWDWRTINVAAEQGNLEMVKYCVANECPIDERACEYAAKNGQLEVLKYLREEGKAPWDFFLLPFWRLNMVISTYSNILLSVSMIIITNGRVGVRPIRVTWTV